MPRENAPKVDDGVVEDKKGETLVTILDVPFGIDDPNEWNRGRRHEKEPTQTIFPKA